MQMNKAYAFIQPVIFFSVVFNINKNKAFGKFFAFENTPFQTFSQTSPLMEMRCNNFVLSQ